MIYIAKFVSFFSGQQGGSVKHINELSNFPQPLIP